MRKNMLNFVVDVLTLLVMFVMVVTGLVIRFVLPPGTGGRHGGHGLLFWGMGRHGWGDVHFWASVVLGVLLVVHVALHWSWVCLTIYRLFGGQNAERLSAARRGLYGAGFLIALTILFGAFIWAAKNVVQEVQSADHVEDQSSRSEADTIEADGEHGHESARYRIHGSMTLSEVGDATGVAVATLKSELGIPQQVSADERLGRLGREYGFSVSKVRDLVVKHEFQSRK